MCKTNIITRIIDCVTKETEVSESLIRSGKKSADIVDARSIAIKIMSEQGLYPSQISSYMHVSSTSVRNLLTNYQERCKQNRILAIYAQNIRNMLAS